MSQSDDASASSSPQKSQFDSSSRPTGLDDGCGVVGATVVGDSLGVEVGIKVGGVHIPPMAKQSSPDGQGSIRPSMLGQGTAFGSLLHESFACCHSLQVGFGAKNCNRSMKMICKSAADDPEEVAKTYVPQ